MSQKVELGTHSCIDLMPFWAQFVGRLGTFGCDRGVPWSRLTYLKTCVERGQKMQHSAIYRAEKGCVLRLQGQI